MLSIKEMKVDIKNLIFEVWFEQEGLEEDRQWGARAQVEHGHPYRYLSAFADTPHEALQELVGVVIPLAENDV